jgi:hypothetical protein
VAKKPDDSLALSKAGRAAGEHAETKLPHMLQDPPESAGCSIAGEGITVADAVIAGAKKRSLLLHHGSSSFPGARVSHEMHDVWMIAQRMKLLTGNSNVPLTTGEAIVIILVVLLIWFTGYRTGAEVTHTGEKTRVIYDCIFIPAPENSGRV